jgi:D-glycero-D-manno-heptose 1,7-bisphosphate phosphatase
MKETAAPRRLALIDRDGTIIVDKVYLSDPDGIELAPGAIEGLRLLRDAGFALVLITNQSGIARGYFDAATLDRIHDRLQSMLAAEGLRLDRIYFCPHGPNDGCDCRKPAPGRVRQAMRDLGFRPDEVVVVGDSDGNIEAASAGRGWPPPASSPRSARRTISSKPPIARACSPSGAAEQRSCGIAAIAG